MAMALTARERVARLLDDDDTPGAFSTRFTMEPDAVALAVEGGGPVSLPVSGPAAKKLIKAARREVRAGRADADRPFRARHLGDQP